MEKENYVHSLKSICGDGGGKMAGANIIFGLPSEMTAMLCLKIIIAN